MQEAPGIFLNGRVHVWNFCLIISVFKHPIRTVCPQNRLLTQPVQSITTQTIQFGPIPKFMFTYFYFLYQIPGAHSKSYAPGSETALHLASRDPTYPRCLAPTAIHISLGLSPPKNTFSLSDQAAQEPPPDLSNINKNRS